MDTTHSVAKFAYLAVVLFVLGMVLVITQHPPATFPGGPPPLIIVVTLAFTGFHLSLLPIVAALDAPPWAKGSGYAWIVVDNVIVFMGYFGVGADLVVPMRWGVHIAAATWIFGASSSARGAERGMGWLAALAFTGASFAGPFVGQAAAGQTLGPAGLFLVVWLVMVGRRLSGASA
jgi:hypothetical protein